MERYPVEMDVYVCVCVYIYIYIYYMFVCVCVNNRQTPALVNPTGKCVNINTAAAQFVLEMVHLKYPWDHKNSNEIMGKSASAVLVHNALN